MDRRARARELLEQALSEVEDELSVRRHELCPEQLGACRSTLRGYLTALDGGALPPKRDRAEPLGRLILDSWPFEVPLGQVILRAERAWRNA
jgi:hypothetical protein